MRPELRRERKPAAEPHRQAGATGARSHPERGRILNIAGAEPDSSQTAYEAWLDQRDARLPLTRADLHSGADRAAERAVAAGGGMQAVIKATGLRTRENVLGLIDPAILERARQNDATRPPAPSPSCSPCRRDERGAVFGGGYRCPSRASCSKYSLASAAEGRLRT
jgi:hypothetical protein